MKKFIFAAVAASMIATPVMAAAAPQHGPQRYDHRYGTKPAPKPGPQKYYKAPARPQQFQYKGNWRKGERFDSRYARNYQRVDHRKYRALKAPPRGYQYVRSGNDAVLIGITSGIIAAVIANAIR